MVRYVISAITLLGTTPIFAWLLIGAGIAALIGETLRRRMRPIAIRSRRR
jgi:uncharacterized membrane protein